jgi:hypothetical protein
MDPSTAPIATGAKHGNTAVVPVNKPVAVAWFPEAVTRPTKGEIKTPHASGGVVVPYGPGANPAALVVCEIDDWSVFQ